MNLSNHQKFNNSVIKHYEDCLEKHGDTNKGVDWPNLSDANLRYEVMLDLLYFNKEKSENIELLDFGCGASHLLDYIQNQNIKNIIYSGLDISDKFINLSKQKHPNNTYYNTDILKSDTIPQFDYIIMNGVFTEKRELTYEEMFEYFTNLLLKVFEKSKKGIAFNVMSKAVEWERWDLFHLPLDILQDLLVKRFTRNFIIRNDYGLYEYTTYIYK